MILEIYGNIRKMKIIFFLFLISIITTHKIENLFLNNEVKNIIN